MKLLGLNICHDASACLFDDGKLIYFNLEERLCRKKHAAGIPCSCLEEIRKITLNIDRVIITSYEFNHNTSILIDNYLYRLGFKINETECFSFFKSHHSTHAYKAFSSSGFSDSLVIVWDGRGSKHTLSNGLSSYETTSAYYFSNNSRPKLLYKKLHKEDPKIIDDPENLKILFEVEDLYNGADTCYDIDENFEFEVLTNIHDIGHYYGSVNRHLKFGDFDCGKLMGLHSYGNKNEMLSNLIYTEETFKGDLFTSFNCFNIDVEKYPFLNTSDEKNSNTLLDLAYETQKGLEKIGLNFIHKMLDRCECKNLILTGGVSLNIVANSFYRKNLPKEINLYVDPLCGDEGNSIGVVQQYTTFHNTKIEIPNTLYLCGHEPSYEFCLKDGERIIENVDYSFIVDLLLDENIVAIFQGKAEAGPRALGNRSILFDPRVKNGKDIVNRVKKREPFRPFACSILLEESHKWFDMSLIEESPHMMYSFDALPGIKDIIPSVIHVDNTCRIQTVTEQQNYHYYNLIKEFFRQTKVPILFNTSFNLAGDAIVETIEDALNTLRRSELEYLYLPEISKLVYVKNNV